MSALAVGVTETLEVTRVLALAVRLGASACRSVPGDLEAVSTTTAPIVRISASGASPICARRAARRLAVVRGCQRGRQPGLIRRGRAAAGLDDGLRGGAGVGVFVQACLDQGPQ